MCCDVHDKQVTAFGQIKSERGRLRRNALAAHEIAFETAARAQSKNSAGQTGGVVPVGAKHWRTRTHKQPRQGDGVVHHFAGRHTKRWWQRHVWQCRASAAARNPTEVLLDHARGFIAIKIAGDSEHRVVRRVIRAEEIRDVFERRLTQMLHRADERVMKWVVRREHEFLQFFPAGTIRLVIDRPAPFVFHDVTLRVEFDLREGGQHTSHAVGLEPQRHRELVRWHGFVVVGALQPGAAVQRTAGALHQLEVFVGFDVGRSLKQHVFEQVGKAGAIKAFVRRTHVIPQVDRNNGRRMVAGEDHGETIGQAVTLDRNLHRVNWSRCRARRNPVLYLRDNNTLAFGGRLVDFTSSPSFATKV